MHCRWMTDLHRATNCRFRAFYSAQSLCVLGPTYNQSTRRKASLPLAVRSSRHLATLAATFVHTLVLLAHLLDARSTRTLDVRSITIVGVDANQLGHTLGLNPRNDHVPGSAIVGAVTAAAVQLTGVYDGEVLDRDCAAAVVLDDFVLSFLGAATFDQDVARAKSRDSIYAFDQPESHIHMLLYSPSQTSLNQTFFSVQAALQWIPSS